MTRVQGTARAANRADGRCYYCGTPEVAIFFDERRQRWRARPMCPVHYALHVTAKEKYRSAKYHAARQAGVTTDDESED